MRSSLQRRFAIGVGTALAAGLLTSAFVLQKFRSYEDSASHVLAGDHRSVVQAQLIETRVRAAIELAQLSANSEQSHETFRERVQQIANDLRDYSKEHSDKSLEEVKRTLFNLSAAKAEPTEDIFVHYRNLKTTAFNVYRMAWANKWMSVAHNMGLIINDLDNLPYNGGERAVASVYSKINPLVALITNSALSKEAKLTLFGQLDSIKSLVSRYNDVIARADKIKQARVEELTQAAGVLKRYNESQGKSVMQFGNEARSEVFKAIIAFGFLILFALFWYGVVAHYFSKHILGIGSHISRQLAGWISTGGNATVQGFIAPAKPDVEFEELYTVVDQIIKRVNGLRREDLLVKRLLSVPVVLINSQKQAIFWNSALSILCKVRALEETGPTTYGNLVRFTNAQGKSIDPVEKVFTENREVSQLALMRIGDDGLAVQAVCTPVLGSDHKTEYVMVHIRDLREENRRADSEIDRQLECVRLALQQIRESKLPSDLPAGMRKPVTECIQMLKDHALELQERSTVLSGQVETMRGRMSREASLKKSVHSRMEQLRDEVRSVVEKLSGLQNAMNLVVNRMSEIETRGKILRNEYEQIRRMGGDLYKDLKSIHSKISQSVKKIDDTEEISSRVRANERMIRSILEKSTVLNANNSILGSKRELTPSDVVTITENLTQLMGHFERSYRFIEQSVNEVEESVEDLSGRLRTNLASCQKLALDDQEILKALQQSEYIVQSSSNEMLDFAKDLAGLNHTSANIAVEIKNVEQKIQRLVQIGQASLDLQTQLESGFEGMFERFEVNHMTGKSTGGMA